MKRILFLVATALVAALLFITPIIAATSQDVTITAAPNYLSISNSPSTWTMNGITGTGLIDTNTTYYSNPLGDTTPPSATVVDAECRFTLTNSSGPPIDLYVNSGNFTGGDANMTNGNTGSNGATTYGAYSWYSGLSYASKVIMKLSGSSILYNEFNGASLKWGAEIKSQTNSWAGSSSSTATMTISAQAD